MNTIRAEEIFIKSFLSQFQLQDFFHCIQNNCLEPFFSKPESFEVNTYCITPENEQVDYSKKPDRTYALTLCLRKALLNAVLT